jgi:hypothetical protein
MKTDGWLMAATLAALAHSLLFHGEWSITASCFSSCQGVISSFIVLVLAVPECTKPVSKQKDEALALRAKNVGSFHLQGKTNTHTKRYYSIMLMPLLSSIIGKLEYFTIQLSRHRKARLAILYLSWF